MKLFSILSMFVLVTVSTSLAAVQPYCSFNTVVTANDYSFHVKSLPDDSCDKQVLNISVMKQAVPFTQFVNSTDTLVDKAWAEDIDEDGIFELLLLSSRYSEPSKKILEIYAVDGNNLKQVRLPQSTVSDGYRGGDRFSIENGKIVRRYPIYLPTDTEMSPGGGEVRAVYQYRNREILAISEKSKTSSTDSQKASKVGSRNTFQPVIVKSIEVRDGYIEIKANRNIDNYKVLRIADPWRLIIDIPGGGTDVVGNEIVIDRYGISKVRVGMYKDRLRLVFDSVVTPLPTETVTPAENALRVGFYQPPPK